MKGEEEGERKRGIFLHSVIGSSCSEENEGRGRGREEWGIFLHSVIGSSCSEEKAKKEMKGSGGKD